MAQPHWQAGGAVNAIEKMGVVLDAVRRLREEWNGRPDKQHPHLSSGTIVPVKISGGEWAVTYPASCSLTCEVMYLPGNADGDGWGREVESEIEAWIATAAAADPWLALHPPAIEWALDIPPAEVDAAHPIVGGRRQGQRRRRRAALARRASTRGSTPPRSRGSPTRPSIGFGPRSLAWGHTIDEYVPVDDLVSCTQALALAAVDYCGVAE